MKLIYISGPYSAPSNLLIEQNILSAKRVAVLCAVHKIGYFCPHTNSANFHLYDPNYEYDWYLELDIAILHYCNAILMMPLWRESPGSARELDEFSTRGRRKFFMKNLDALPPELIEWYFGD